MFVTVGRGLAPADTEVAYTAGADSPNPEPFCPLRGHFPCQGNHPRPTSGYLSFLLSRGCAQTSPLHIQHPASNIQYLKTISCFWKTVRHKVWHRLEFFRRKRTKALTNQQIVVYNYYSQIYFEPGCAALLCGAHMCAVLLPLCSVAPKHGARRMGPVS